MEQISKLPVYAGTIPNKATQSDDEFANNIFGFLNYSGNSFVRDFNVIVDEFNTLSDEVQTAASSASTNAGQAKTARDEAVGALATLTAGAIDNTNKANNKAYSNIKVDELLQPVTNKLGGIEDNANNYSHPLSHDASMITESTTKRFVSDIEKTSWNAKLDASSGVPIGTVIDFASPTAPAGYLKCNGALISRSAYSALFSVIGTTYGEGDGSTTFALPDRRGLFPRGWDDGRGIDVGRVFGSKQEDIFKAHYHLQGDAHQNPVGRFGATPDIGASVNAQSSGATDAYNTSTVGGAETRPKNIATNYCIKY